MTIRSSALAEAQQAAEVAREAAAITADKIAALIELPEDEAPDRRVAMTISITEATAEWLRRAAFENHVSQQSLVDQALDRLRTDRGGE